MDAMPVLTPTRRTGLWLMVSVLVIVLDQLTKFYFETNFTLYESHPVFPGFNFVLAHNNGAAFSFLADQSGWQHYLFGVLAVVTVVAGLYFLLTKPLSTAMRLAVALFIGGAIGNFFDRMYWGYVVDFIDLYYKSYHWPAFNIADMALTGAVILVIVSEVFHFKKGASS